MKAIAGVTVAVVCVLGGRAWADGYCDRVEGVASAEAATLYSPELVGSIGFGEQPPSDVATTPDNSVRLIAGLTFHLGDVAEAVATKKRAKADCQRHVALDKVEGASSYRAMAARAEVLDAALDKAEEMLADADADLRARRATASEVDATRLRVDEVRRLAAEAHEQLEGLPKPDEGATLQGALGSYYRADAEIEAQEGALRKAESWDVSLRIGYDQFLGRVNDPPFFAIVTLSLDLGWFAQGPANKRAAAGRSRQIREEHGFEQVDETSTRLQAVLDLEVQREKETGVLVDDLAKQLKALQKVSGDESRRYRETVWFDWVKVNAEHEYLAAHVASLREILGEDAAK